MPDNNTPKPAAPGTGPATGQGPAPSVPGAAKPNPSDADKAAESAAEEQRKAAQQRTEADERALAKSDETDTASAERHGAVAGATAVADAVKKVADAAVDTTKKTGGAPLSDFIAVGTAGGGFEINGSGFGAGGTVTMNGQQVNTVSWSNNRITGTLPNWVKDGEIVVHVDKETVRKGRIKVGAK